LSDKEYFESNLFNAIIKKMGIKQQFRYQYDNSIKISAYNKGSIRFNRDWIDKSAPIVRCAALIHETEHAKTERLRTITLGIATIPFIPALLFIPQNLERLEIQIFFIIGVFLTLLKIETRLNWIFEDKSDDAAVLHLGASPAINMFDGIEEDTRFFKRFFSMHPPIEKRRERMRKMGEKIEKPILNFNEIEHRANENMNEWRQDRPLDWGDLPKGKYFYHATPQKRLMEISSKGLMTPDSHKKGKEWNIPFYSDKVTDRLFFFTNERSCLRHVHIYKKRKMVALRFRREIILGALLFKDPGYVDNEVAELEPISFSANVKIPAKVLEKCKKIKWDEEQGRDITLNWVSLKN